MKKLSIFLLVFFLLFQGTGLFHLPLAKAEKNTERAEKTYLISLKHDIDAGGFIERRGWPKRTLKN